MNKKWKCQIQNLHTHTYFSDGKSSPEEMVKAAIEMGFDSLGFSEHSFIENIRERWLLPEKTAQYLAELDRLKEKYEKQIKIFKGIELDSCSQVSTDPFDYVIGNVHFCPMWDGGFTDYCHNSDYTARKFIFYYDFDTVAFAKDYFERYVSFFDRRRIDIAGHFDALTKFCEVHKDLYDFESDEYKRIALEALHAVREKCEIFEVNAGHMGRGIRKYPCPEPFLLRELKNLNAKVCVTTDAHSEELLNRCVDETFELLLACGFDKVTILTENGFEEQRII